MKTYYKRGDGELKCECGGVIPDDDIYYSNKCNEEGEDYHTIEAECPICHKEYDISGWGEAEDKEDVKEELDYYIKGD